MRVQVGILLKCGNKLKNFTMGIYPQKAFKLKLQILNSRILQCTYYIYAQVKIRSSWHQEEYLQRRVETNCPWWLPVSLSRWYSIDISSNQQYIFDIINVSRKTSAGPNHQWFDRYPDSKFLIPFSLTVNIEQPCIPPWLYTLEFQNLRTLPVKSSQQQNKTSIMSDTSVRKYFGGPTIEERKIITDKFHLLNYFQNKTTTSRFTVVLICNHMNGKVA